MSVDFHVVIVLDGDGSPLECMMLVLNVDPPVPDVPIIGLSDVVACSCQLMMWIMREK